MNDPVLLNGTREKVQICLDGITLQAPGFTGVIEEVNAHHRPTRSLSLDEQEEEKLALLAALKDDDLEITHEFELEVHDDGEAVATRSLSGKAPSINMEVPITDGKVPLAVLHYDEAGIPQLIFPSAATRSLSGATTFVIPRKKAVQMDGERIKTRGEKKGLLKRIIRVISGAVGGVVKKGVTKWENKHRPYGLNLIAGPKVTSGIANWDQFARSGVPSAEGTTLLMIPGTFKNTEGSFGPLLESSSMDFLYDHYRERVLAFDHPNLHQSPSENVEWLLDNLPKDRVHNFDLLTASRGGLVAREFIRRVASNDTKGRKITINKALLVAACNQGTALADPENIKNLLNRYMLMTSLIPIPMVSKILGGILAVVRGIGSAALTHLPGLSDQAARKDNDFLKTLNANYEHKTAIYGIGANYNPQNANIKSYLMNTVVDRLFQDEANDVVVPTQGCFEAPGAYRFPIKHIEYDETKDIFHMNYFKTETVRKQIENWLGEPIPVA
ncbi:MAG: hypothetical protein AAF655_27930 [Bacteroidota bacterium]